MPIPAWIVSVGMTALSCATQLQERIPEEKSVQLGRLANGVVTYVQENSVVNSKGAYRVVSKQKAFDEVLYAYDARGEQDEAVDGFFSYCTDKLKGMDHLHGLAVVAVGDFPSDAMQGMIEKHFGTVALEGREPLPCIAVCEGGELSKVAVKIAYPIPQTPIETFGDLKERWKHLMLQALFQQRLEVCSKMEDEEWEHPHPRFFYPVRGYALSSPEVSENLFSYLLWHVEMLRASGFTPSEFEAVKIQCMNLMQHMASSAAEPTSRLLASYYADQYLLGERCLSYDSFLSASADLIREIELEDLDPLLANFFDDEQRYIELVYPEGARHLTVDRVKEITEEISSLASFQQEGEMEDFEIHLLSHQPASFSIQLAGEITSTSESFYQLPITDKEKQLIHSIITTMADKNIFQLAFVKRSMEKKGDRIHHVHPLRFAGHILSTPELKRALRVVRKSSFKWDAFVDGFAKRMREELGKGNVYPHVFGFAELLHADPQRVKHYIDHRDFEGLLNHLL
ncbi:MAG: hypothetical protein JSS61_03875 [Verrucomicrobia bacterium]|nr:hypothetical protein [Verrucomicrobiota bacterium]